tara:strand:+ start:5380 stop:5874 length:495 start_codon:yes stop_codon:yes gene_type:complete
MLVQMTPAETVIALTLAVMRNTTARQHNVADKQMGKQDPIEIDRDGLLAEMAFGKKNNLYPDFTIGPRQGGADLITHNGLTIDVKATRYKTGRLVIHSAKQIKDADLYVLGIVSDNAVDLVGYIKAIDALKEENIGDLGHGKGYLIEQSRLTKFKTERAEDGNP